MSNRYTYNDVAEILRIRPKSVCRLASKHGVKAQRNGLLKYFSDEDVEVLKNNVNRFGPKTKTERKPCTAKKTQNRIYYRVSVFEPALNAYIVKKCSLLKKEADRLCEEYTWQGLMARSSPCRKKIKPGRKTWD